MGDSVIRYSIDTPPKASFSLIDIVGYSKEKELVADIFNKAIRWSSGGWVPMNAWAPQYPQGKEYLSKNFCLCSWAFNHIYCFHALQFMASPERSRFLNRAGFRYFEPLERYAYKLAYRYREEPFSSLNYPVMLPPFYRNLTNYEANYGSSVIFGDENEPGYILPVIARLASNVAGQKGVTLVNWNLLRDTMAFTLASEDWACMTSGCRENWEGCFIDMLNCEYPMMREYERLARANGDIDIANNALYRASRRMIPTLMRFSFQDYMREFNLPNADKKIRFITGWSETGATFLLENSTYGTNDVFDVAGGVSEDLLVLYKLYVNDIIRDKMVNVIIPAFRDKVILNYMAMLAIFGMPHKEIDQMKKNFEENVPQGLYNDHYGMGVYYNLGIILFSRHSEIFIDSTENLIIEKAEYDPASQSARFVFNSGSQGSMNIYSAFVPEQIILNGQNISIPSSASDGIMSFKADTAKQILEIKLGKVKNNYRHPIIKDLALKQK